MANAPVFYNTASTSTQWYFYNNNTITAGKNEFKQRWGGRPLEDLWRLKNKTPIIEDYFAEDTTMLASDSIKNLSDPAKREYYLKNIPKTPEDFSNSNKRIEEAIYTAGKIYFTNLKEYDKALYYFQELNRRFPNNNKADEAFYLCYISAKEIGKNNDMLSCKDSLLRLYPNSFYAHLVLDPEYYKHIASEEDLASEYLLKTFTALQNNQFSEVLALTDTGITKFHDLSVLAKLSFMKSISLANLTKTDTLLSLLPEIIRSYPNTEVASQSEYLLALLNENNPNKNNNNNQNSDKNSAGIINNPYIIPNEDDIHLIIISFDPLKVTANEMKIAISDFNEQSYKSVNFNVNVTFLTDTRMIASIGYFNSKTKALNYYNTIKENQQIKNLINVADGKIFVINSINYPKFFTEKNEENYINFFNENYLK